MSDSQQTEIVKGINSIAEHAGKAAIDPNYETSSQAYTAYKEGGVKGRREATLLFDREDSPIERASIAGNPPCNTPTSGLEVSVS